MDPEWDDVFPIENGGYSSQRPVSLPEGIFKLDPNNDVVVWT